MYEWCQVHQISYVLMRQFPAPFTPGKTVSNTSDLLHREELGLSAVYTPLSNLLTYVSLSQLAIDVLSAFAMSAESERTFSKARRITPWERSQLRINIIRCS